MDTSLQKQQQTTPDLYAAPDAELAPQESTEMAYGQAHLADRGTRLGAFLLDGLILFGLFVGAFFMSGMLSGVLGDAALIFAVIPILGLFGYNLYLLVDNAQTLGKKIMGIKIVRSDLRTQPSIWRIIFLRYLPVNLASNIPCVGTLLYLANFLIIFRHDKKCGHDHIADTHVVVDSLPGTLDQPAYGTPPQGDQAYDPLAAEPDDQWPMPDDSGTSQGRGAPSEDAGGGWDDVDSTSSGGDSVWDVGGNDADLDDPWGDDDWDDDDWDDDDSSNQQW